MKEYMKECIKETLDECGEKLSDKCINDIAESVICYYENRELSFGIVSRPSVALEDVKRTEEIYKRRIAEFEAREKIFIDSICKRRNVEPHQVCIEGKSVVYYPDGR